MPSLPSMSITWDKESSWLPDHQEMSQSNEQPRSTGFTLGQQIKHNLAGLHPKIGKTRNNKKRKNQTSSDSNSSMSVISLPQRCTSPENANQDVQGPGVDKVHDTTMPDISKSSQSGSTEHIFSYKITNPKLKRSASWHSLTLGLVLVILILILFSRRASASGSTYSIIPSLGTIALRVADVDIPVGTWTHVVDLRLPCLRKEDTLDQIEHVGKMLSHAREIIKGLTKSAISSSRDKYPLLKSNPILIATLYKLTNSYNTSKVKMDEILHESQTLWGLMDAYECPIDNESADDKPRRKRSLKTSIPMNASGLHIHGTINNFYHQNHFNHNPMTNQQAPDKKPAINKYHHDRLDVVDQYTQNSLEHDVKQNQNYQNNPELSNEDINRVINEMLPMGDQGLSDKPRCPSTSPASNYQFNNWRSTTHKLIVNQYLSSHYSNIIPDNRVNSYTGHSETCILVSGVKACMNNADLDRIIAPCKSTTHRRLKRSWLPGIGLLHKMLFGVATTDDVTELNERVAKVQETNMKNVKNLQKSVKDLISYSSQVDKRVSASVNMTQQLAARLNELVAHTYELQGNFTAVINKTMTGVSIMEMNVGLSNIISLIATTLNDLLMRLDDITSYHLQLRQMIKGGTLELSVVGRDVVRDIIDYVKAAVPAEYRVVTTWSRVKDPQWKISKVISGSNILRLVMEIPLAASRADVEVWKVVSLPFKMFPACAVMIIPTSLYLVDVRNSQWTPITELEWDNCDPKGQKLCNMPFVWSSISEDSCISALQTSNLGAAKRFCDLEILACNSTTPLSTAVISPTQWFVSTTAGQAIVRKTCIEKGGGDISVETTVENIAVIEVAPGCQTTIGTKTFTAPVQHGSKSSVTRVAMPSTILGMEKSIRETGVADMSSLASGLVSASKNLGESNEILKNIMASNRIGRLTWQDVEDVAKRPADQNLLVIPTVQDAVLTVKDYDAIFDWSSSHYVLLTVIICVLLLLVCCCCFRGNMGSMAMSGITSIIPFKSYRPPGPYPMAIIGSMNFIGVNSLPSLEGNKSVSHLTSSLNQTLTVKIQNNNTVDPDTIGKLVDHAFSHSTNMSTWMGLVIMLLVSVACHMIYKHYTAKLMIRLVSRMGVYPQNMHCRHIASEMPVTILISCRVLSFSGKIQSYVDIGSQVATLPGVLSNWKMKDVVKPSSALSGYGCNRLNSKFVVSLIWPAMCITHTTRDVETCQDMPQKLELFTQDVISQLQFDLGWFWWRIVPDRVTLIRLGDLHNSVVLYEALNQ